MDWNCWANLRSTSRVQRWRQLDLKKQMQKTKRISTPQFMQGFVEPRQHCSSILILGSMAEMKNNWSLWSWCLNQPNLKERRIYVYIHYSSYENSWKSFVSPFGSKLVEEIYNSNCHANMRSSQIRSSASKKHPSVRHLDLPGPHCTRCFKWITG